MHHQAKTKPVVNAFIRDGVKSNHRKVDMRADSEQRSRREERPSWRKEGAPGGGGCTLGPDGGPDWGGHLSEAIRLMRVLPSARYDHGFKMYTLQGRCQKCVELAEAVVKLETKFTHRVAQVEQEAQNGQRRLAGELSSLRKDLESRQSQEVAKDSQAQMQIMLKSSSTNVSLHGISAIGIPRVPYSGADICKVKYRTRRGLTVVRPTVADYPTSAQFSFRSLQEYRGVSGCIDGTLGPSGMPDAGHDPHNGQD
eukprot:gene2415-8732_t